MQNRSLDGLNASSRASPATYRFAPKSHYCVLFIYLWGGGGGGGVVQRHMFALDLIDNPYYLIVLPFVRSLRKLNGVDNFSYYKVCILNIPFEERRD